MEMASKCGDLLVNAERTFVIPPVADAEGKVRSGEVNWFDLEHGGYISIWRTLIPGPNYYGTEIPSERWNEARIAGLPAVIGTGPVDGLGHATVIVWNPDTKVLTVVRGLDRTLDEITAVAEEVAR